VVPLGGIQKVRSSKIPTFDTLPSSPVVRLCSFWPYSLPLVRSFFILHQQYHPLRREIKST